jgi:hypothetical protein
MNMPWQAILHKVKQSFHPTANNIVRVVETIIEFQIHVAHGKHDERIRSNKTGFKQPRHSPITDTPGLTSLLYQLYIVIDIHRYSLLSLICRLRCWNQEFVC